MLRSKVKNVDRCLKCVEEVRHAGWRQVVTSRVERKGSIRQDGCERLRVYRADKI